MSNIGGLSGFVKWDKLRVPTEITTGTDGDERKRQEWEFGDINETGMRIGYDYYQDFSYIASRRVVETNGVRTLVERVNVFDDEGRFCYIDETDTPKRYLIDGEGGGAGEVPSLQSVTSIGNFSTHRLRYKSGDTYQNYALEAELGLDAVLTNSNIAKRDIVFEYLVGSNNINEPRIVWKELSIGEVAVFDGYGMVRFDGTVIDGIAFPTIIGCENRMTNTARYIANRYGPITLAAENGVQIFANNGIELFTNGTIKILTQEFAYE